MKIDLQLHSTYSDGVYEPSWLIRHAKEGGLDMVSLTDHDSTWGVAEALATAEEVNIVCVPGIELSAQYRNEVLHVLGYNISIENQELKELTGTLLDYRKQKILEKIPEINKQLLEREKGELNVEDMLAKVKFFGKPAVAQYLVSVGLVESRNEGIAVLAPVNYKDLKTDIADVISVIHKAGGVAILSHPFAPLISLRLLDNDEAGLERMVKELVSFGLDGLEVFQAAHTEEDSNLALRMSDKFGLLYSGGSDWHGPLSVLGGGITKYVPNYLEDFADFSVPEPYVTKIYKTFNKK